MTFSERAKPLKDKSSMTLAEIAEECNISESMVSRYINGKIVPPADIAEKMLELLGGATQEQKQESDDMGIVIDRISAMYENQIKVLQREKYFLAGLVIVLFIVILYLCIDALHGNWGFFQYPVY